MAKSEHLRNYLTLSKQISLKGKEVSKPISSYPDYEKLSVIKRRLKADTDEELPKGLGYLAAKDAASKVATQVERVAPKE